MTTKQRGGRRDYQPGRPRKSLEEKTPRHDGKYAFWISGEHALKLQSLMLRDVPGVGTPDQMIEYLIDEETKMKYIVQGQKYIGGYKYDIRDGFRSVEDARDYRDQLKAGTTTMPGGYAPDTRDTFSIASYESRSYEATFVE